jgi:hypothetical protein
MFVFSFSTCSSHSIDKLIPPVNSSEYLALEKNKKLDNATKIAHIKSQIGDFLIIANFAFIFLN